MLITMCDDNPSGILNPGKTRKNIHTGFFEPYNFSKGWGQVSNKYIQHIYSYSTLSNYSKAQHGRGNKFANTICCLSLSFASGIIVLMILVIPLMVPLDVVIDIDIVVICLLELILVIFNFSKPPHSLQLTVFFKMLIDDCDEDKKEILWLIHSEDVDGANTQIG